MYVREHDVRSQDVITRPNFTKFVFILPVTMHGSIYPPLAALR